MNLTETFISPFDLLQEKILLWYNQGLNLLPELFAALVVFGLFWYISNITEPSLKKLLSKSFSNTGLANFISVLLKIVIIAFGFILAINILKLDKAVTSILAGIGIIGFALGFAFQDMAANLVSGIALVIREDYPFKVGDFIETDGIQGFVREIDLRSTTLETPQGHNIIIPNKKVYESHIHNLTSLGKRRIDIDISVDYKEDLERVEAIAKNAIANLSGLSPTEKVEVFYQEFGEYAVKLKLIFWVKLKEGTEHVRARHLAIKLLKSAFDNNGISLPYPVTKIETDLSINK
jgi:small conductance mechanosensitive channel